MKCIFCKADTKYGNNASPLSDKPCCIYCNTRLVMPARFAEMRKEPLRARLVNMYDEPRMKAGIEGTVKYVDDIGQIHVNWDNGSTLALNPEKDIFSLF